MTNMEYKLFYYHEIF